MFYGSPSVHYVEPENGHWPPLCGFSGAESHTNSEAGVTCHDCAAILGVEPMTPCSICCNPTYRTGGLLPMLVCTDDPTHFKRLTSGEDF